MTNLPAVLPSFKYDKTDSWGPPGNTACDGGLCKCVCGLLDQNNTSSKATCEDMTMKERAALSCQVLNGVELTPPPNESGTSRQASIVYTNNSNKTRTAAFASLFDIMKPDGRSSVTVLTLGGSEDDNTEVGPRTFTGADALTAPQSMTLYPKFGERADKYTPEDPSFLSGHEGFIDSLRDAMCANVTCRLRSDKNSPLEKCEDVSKFGLQARKQVAVKCVDPDLGCPEDQQNKELGVCVSPFGRDLLKALDGINAAAGNRELVIAGHSLGGAFAQVAARFVQLKYPNIKIRLFPFAAPRALAKDITDEMNGVKNMSRPYPETGWPNAGLTASFPGLRPGGEPRAFESLPESGSEKQNLVARWIVTGDAVPALLPEKLKCRKSEGWSEKIQQPLYCYGASWAWAPPSGGETPKELLELLWQFLFKSPTSDFEWEAGFVGFANRANFDLFELQYTGEGRQTLREPTWAPSSVTPLDVATGLQSFGVTLWVTPTAHVRYVKWLNFWGTQDNGGQPKRVGTWNTAPSAPLKTENKSWKDGRANRVPWNFGNAVQNRQDFLGTSKPGNGMGQSCFQVDYVYNATVTSDTYISCKVLAGALGQDKNAEYVAPSEAWEEKYSNSSTYHHWANTLTALDAAVGVGGESYNITDFTTFVGQNKPGEVVNWTTEGRPKPAACPEYGRMRGCNGQRECGWLPGTGCVGAEEFCRRWATEFACGNGPRRWTKCKWEEQACRAVIPGTSGEFIRGCCLKGKVSGEPCSWPVPLSDKETNGCPSTEWTPWETDPGGFGPAGTGVESKT